LFENEIHNGLRVIKSVRMMIARRLVDDGDLSAKFLVALLEDRRVFLDRDGLVQSDNLTEEHHQQL
jgi:hypothetical protein